MCHAPATPGWRRHVEIERRLHRASRSRSVLAVPAALILAAAAALAIGAAVSIGPGRFQEASIESLSSSAAMLAVR